MIGLRARDQSLIRKCVRRCAFTEADRYSIIKLLNLIRIFDFERAISTSGVTVARFILFCKKKKKNERCEAPHSLTF